MMLHSYSDCNTYELVRCIAGASLAAAIFVPNIEFIFGLIGSTAAALLAFIFPAWTFLLTEQAHFLN